MPTNAEVHLNRFKSGAESIFVTRQMLKVFFDARKGKMNGADIKFFEKAIARLDDFGDMIPHAISAMEIMANQEKAAVSNIFGIVGNA